MATTVVTRFPPSPTGFLHIGGARTALFNWLYAKANGGKMVLRIEDTDKERSTQEAIDAIMEGLKWLELEWDGEPVFQASRADRHIEVANQLLASGDAYYCYCSQEELQTMRETARAEGRAVVYDGTWRDRPASDAPVGIKPVLRFKSPSDGQVIIKDQVQGDVTFANKDLDDLILLRSDGSPTYNLSVIVDDHDMGVTHIMRGVDHLTNAARQSVIYNALGWDIPVMAHIPLIHGPDGAKLSKRHGALGVEAYRAMGYLPAAMRNYLSRLGWSHGDDEIFTTKQAIEWFDFGAVGKSASRFDFDKLENLNGHYIRQMGDDELLGQLHNALPYLPNGPDFSAKLCEDNRDALLKSLPVLKERAKTLVELVDSAHFVVASRPLPIDEKSQSILADLDAGFLQALHDKLNGVATWNHDTIKDAVKEFADDKGLKLGKVAPALRAALTGSTKSPGIFDVLEILGKQETIARLADQL